VVRLGYGYRATGRGENFRRERQAHRFHALPERSANICFGGVKRNRLFMAASHSVYSLFVNTQGAPGG